MSVVTKVLEIVKNPYLNRNSPEFKFRLKRFRLVREIIDEVLCHKGVCRILDVGGTRFYWELGRDLIESEKITVDLLNLVEAPSESAPFRTITGDARNMSDITDNFYDLVHSNSVIEHVGDWRDMTAMAHEVRRLAPRYFVQTPYFWFPFEPHFRFLFFHWFPEQIRYRLLMMKKLGYYNKQDAVSDAVSKIQSARLLDKSQFSTLFPDANIVSERVGFLTKSLMAIRKGNGSS